MRITASLIFPGRWRSRGLGHGRRDWLMMTFRGMSVSFLLACVGMMGMPRSFSSCLMFMESSVRLAASILLRTRMVGKPSSRTWIAR